jgi:hypothetical protein
MAEEMDPCGHEFGCFGLNPERHYSDLDEAAEDIEDCLGESIDSFYDGLTGECSEQMHKLYRLLKARGITLYNGIPEGWFFFDVGNAHYEVTDSEKGLRIVCTKGYDCDGDARLNGLVTAMLMLGSCLAGMAIMYECQIGEVGIAALMTVAMVVASVIVMEAVK